MMAIFFFSHTVVLHLSLCGLRSEGMFVFVGWGHYFYLYEVCCYQKMVWLVGFSVCLLNQYKHLTSLFEADYLAGRTLILFFFNFPPNFVW